jgi:hypothetical protein
VVVRHKILSDDILSNDRAAVRFHKHAFINTQCQPENPAVPPKNPAMSGLSRTNVQFVGGPDSCSSSWCLRAQKTLPGLFEGAVALHCGGIR